ncbi:hypothetical protein SAMN04488018_10946 [Myroides marinus]|uniref:Uncharacterized protein n=1 Tax=Myroides marinus TaxID=703342 RepID=A0A1H6VGL5_9FLAO|nr:hypothetical protein [Myroides marinus]SEJ00897.1 hypothetical protein SAMN04488018_10946 [Myroides marinus]
MKFSSVFNQSIIVRIIVGIVLIAIIDVVLISLFFMVSKGIIQATSIESVILTITIMTLLLIYILNISYKYLNHISIDKKEIIIKTVLGKRFVFNTESNEVRIHFSTLSIIGSDKEGCITISERAKKIVLLEGYYKNYGDFKSELLALTK